MSGEALALPVLHRRELRPVLLVLHPEPPVLLVLVRPEGLPVAPPPVLGQGVLAEAGYAEGKGLRPIQILYNSSDQHRVVFEALQEMWRRGLGVRIELTSANQFGQTKIVGDALVALA